MRISSAQVAAVILVAAVAIVGGGAVFVLNSLSTQGTVVYTIKSGPAFGGDTEFSYFTVTGRTIEYRSGTANDNVPYNTPTYRWYTSNQRNKKSAGPILADGTDALSFNNTARLSGTIAGFLDAADTLTFPSGTAGATIKVEPWNGTTGSFKVTAKENNNGETANNYYGRYKEAGFTYGPSTGESAETVSDRDMVFDITGGTITNDGSISDMTLRLVRGKTVASVGYSAPAEGDNEAKDAFGLGRDVPNSTLGKATLTRKDGFETLTIPFTMIIEAPTPPAAGSGSGAGGLLTSEDHVMSGAYVRTVGLTTYYQYIECKREGVIVATRPDSGSGTSYSFVGAALFGMLGRLLTRNRRYSEVHRCRLSGFTVASAVIRCYAMLAGHNIRALAGPQPTAD